MNYVGRTHLTVEHEIKDLQMAGFFTVDALRHWGATYMIKVVKGETK